MSALIVDTSAWIDYFRDEGEVSIIESALGEGSLYLPAPVAGELLSGRLTRRRRQDLESFLSELPSIGLDPADWRRSGTLRSELAGKGIVASMIDSHVACCALTIHGFLLSRDKIFQKMAKVIGLQLIE